MMFGLKWLRKPEDLLKAVRHVKDMAPSVISDVSVELNPRSVVLLLDDFSDKLCKVIDCAQVIRCAYKDRNWKQAANQTRQELHQFIDGLNSNTVIQHALERALQSEDELSQEEIRVARNLLRDCSVIQSSDLSSQLMALEDKFIRNLNDSETLPIFHMLDTNKTLVGTNSNVNHLLRWSSSEDFRKEVYHKANTTPAENTSILADIIDMRREMSRVMHQSPSFAHHTCENNSLAAIPQAVTSHLHNLSTKIADKGQEQYMKLKESQKITKVEPWDRLYYMGNAKSALCKVDSALLAQFLSLSSCLNGLKIVLEELFDVKCQIVQETECGSWCENLYKVSISDGQRELGVVYLDLFTRSGKIPQNAHYTIQCSKRLGGDERQLAIVALLCDFKGYELGGKLVLFPGEVETLFHEFGHALHSIFSESDFHYLSGTRCEIDFIEVPSLLFEKYAMHPLVLERYAKNVLNGEKITQLHVESWKTSKDFFWALDLQMQIAYALFDQKVHSEGFESNEISEVFFKIEEAVSLIPHARGTFPYGRFQHLIHYPAYYYTYIYSKCIADGLWTSYLADDPFSAGGGEKVRKLLALSGSLGVGKTLVDLNQCEAFAFGDDKYSILPKTCI